MVVSAALTWRVRVANKMFHSTMSPVSMRPPPNSARRLISCATRRASAGLVVAYLVVFCFMAHREPARHCWPGQSPAKQACLSSWRQVPAFRKNLPASERRACDASSPRERKFRLALFSSTRSTPWDDNAGAVTIQQPLTRIKRSINC